jgi:DNA-binding transcriptional LysR family regulator
MGDSVTTPLPSFKSIEAFAVAARESSFTRAAEALHITVPAVAAGSTRSKRRLACACFNASRMLSG